MTIGLHLFSRPSAALSQPFSSTDPQSVPPNVRELKHDFGRVPAGFSGRCQFAIHNDSDSIWTVARVTTGCSCTVAELADHVIEPGEKVEVSVTYRGDTESVDDKRTVTVAFVEHAAPVFQLHVLANIRRPLTAFPRELDLKVHAGETIPFPSLTALLYFPSRMPVQAISSEQWVKAVVVPIPIPESLASNDTLRPFHAYRIDVSIDASSEVVSHRNAVLTLKNPDIDGSVAVPVRLQVLPLRSGDERPHLRFRVGQDQRTGRRHKGRSLRQRRCIVDLTAKLKLKPRLGAPIQNRHREDRQVDGPLDLANVVSRALAHDLVRLPALGFGRCEKQLGEAIVAIPHGFAVYLEDVAKLHPGVRALWPHQQDV